MPIPEDKLYRPERMHILFAVSSVLMTASIIWIIAVDYARPWHAHQDAHFVGKAALAHLDYLDATRQDRLQVVEEASARLADAEVYAEQTTGPERARLVAELAAEIA